MHLLLIEDDEPKREHILTFLEDSYPAINVRTARSVRTAIESLKTFQADLILLDISLDTFDRGQNEPGGRPQGFGGTEVLRYMDILEIKTPVIVITGYEAFSRDGHAIDHSELSKELTEQHPENYKGLVYYNSVYEAWQNHLRTMIAEISN